MSQSVFDAFLLRYGPKAGVRGPLRFVKEVLGIKADRWQRIVLMWYGAGERRISIRACHGPGKTAVAAWIILHHIITRFPQKTVATAPSRDQLEDALVAEVMTWFKYLPQPIQDLFDEKKNRLELKLAPDESFFSARTARAEKPEALAGVHSENVLLIADEASGVDEAIYESAAGSMSGHNALTLLLGNPVRSSGLFFDTHHSLKDMWKTMKVGAADSPRVTDDFVEQIRRQYGEPSNAFNIRVLGEFPKADDDVIIPFDLLQAAQDRDVVATTRFQAVWAVDCARFGPDFNVLLKRNNLMVLPDIKKWQGVDTMQTVGRAKHEWDHTPPHERPREILVDSIGLGGGVADRLRELGLPARDINVSETDSVDEEYRNLRTELGFKARRWLEGKACSLPDGEDIHAELVTQVAAIRYGYTSSGKLIMEPKSETKKRLRGNTSPDVADAFFLSFASEFATMTRGGKGGWGSQDWNEPINRDIPVV